MWPCGGVRVVCRLPLTFFFLHFEGLKNQVLVMNTATDVRRTFKTNSDVLAQQFATEVYLFYYTMLFCSISDYKSIFFFLRSFSPGMLHFVFYFNFLQFQLYNSFI